MCHIKGSDYIDYVDPALYIQYTQGRIYCRAKRAMVRAGKLRGVAQAEPCYLRCFCFFALIYGLANFIGPGC